MPNTIEGPRPVVATGHPATQKNLVALPTEVLSDVFMHTLRGGINTALGDTESLAAAHPKLGDALNKPGRQRKTYQRLLGQRRLIAAYWDLVPKERRLEILLPLYDGLDVSQRQELDAESASWLQQVVACTDRRLGRRDESDTYKKACIALLMRRASSREALFAAATKQVELASLLLCMEPQGFSDADWQRLVAPAVAAVDRLYFLTVCPAEALIELLGERCAASEADIACLCRKVYDEISCETTFLGNLMNELKILKPALKSLQRQARVCLLPLFVDTLVLERYVPYQLMPLEALVASWSDLNAVQRERVLNHIQQHTASLGAAQYQGRAPLSLPENDASEDQRAIIEALNAERMTHDELYRQEQQVAVRIAFEDFVAPVCQ